MLRQESVIPSALLTYIEGLKSHNVELIGSTFAEEIQFITPVKSMDKNQILEFLSALYRGFPDWTYQHDPALIQENGTYAVNWRQGGV